MPTKQLVFSLIDNSLEDAMDSTFISQEVFREVKKHDKITIARTKRAKLYIRQKLRRYGKTKKKTIEKSLIGRYKNKEHKKKWVRFEESHQAETRSICLIIS